MLKLLGLSPNHIERPKVSGVPHARASLDWRTKPWACTFTRNVIQRFEVRPGDRGYDGDFANGNERSELVTADQVAQGLLYPFGVDVWLSFAFMVEPGASVASDFAIVGQMHDWHDPSDTIGLSPPLCFVLGAGSDTIGLSLQTRYDANPATGVQPPSTTRWGELLARSAWIDIVLRVKFGYQNDAELQLWTDGEERINLSGINIGFNHSTADAAGYWQYGIYRQASGNALAVRYANMEQGVASLLDRVENPLPVPGR